MIIRKFIITLGNQSTLGTLGTYNYHGKKH